MIDAPSMTFAREFGGICHFDRAVTSSRQNTCALDGRIDDCDGDCEALALSLYEWGGAPALRSLIGDWSLAICDRERRQIVLASDYAGSRPLYYYRSNGFVAWDTSLPRLAARTGRAALDLDYVAEYLTSGFPSSASPYAGICSVPAGCALAISARSVETTILWTPPLETSIHYTREEEYEEQFRSLFEQAVSVRLQTQGVVAAELSGGLDSSSIVCMANRLIATGAVPAEGLLTFSYEEPGSPDLRYMAEVERVCPTVRPVHLEIAEFPFLWQRSASASRPTFAESRLAEMSRHMRAAGSSVILTGQLGDLITGNVLDDSLQAADLLRAGRLGSAMRQLLAWSRSARVPVYGLAWNALQAACGWQVSSQAPSQAEDSLTAPIQERAREIAKQRARDQLVVHATPSRRARIFALRQMFAGRFFQCPDPLNGLLYSHPYTHRPLVDFLLAIPPGVVCRPGERRRLMRRALRGLLPDALLRRRSKGNYEGMFLKAMRACAVGMADAPESLMLARMGCVDAAGVRSRLLRLNQGLPCNEPQLRQLILLELWLRQRVQDGVIQETR